MSNTFFGKRYTDQKTNRTYKVQDTTMVRGHAFAMITMKATSSEHIMQLSSHFLRVLIDRGEMIETV